MQCSGCGCTDEQACPGGCQWVSLNPPVCSACVDEGLGGVSLVSEGDRCPASDVGASCKPIWTSDVGGHCGQGFFA